MQQSLLACFLLKYDKYLPKFWLLCLFVLYSTILSAQVTITGIATTESTCANNGTITITATGTTPPLVYSITAGPLTQPIQTSPVFNSLPAGSYTIQVADGSGSSTTQNAVVAGTYQQPDFQPVTILPYCAGNANGSIIGNHTSGTGSGPFTWQLIAPSPVTTGPQPADTFSNLSAGNYTVRLTDACGGFRTTVVTLPDPPASNMMFQLPPKINIIGCDTGLAVMYLYADLVRFPLTCTFETNAGIFTTTNTTLVDTTTTCCGYFSLEQILPGFKNGDYLRVTITDNCGSTLTSPYYASQPFYFCSNIQNYFSNCMYNSVITFDLNNVGCYGNDKMTTGTKGPLTYQVYDALTSVLADADTVHGYRDNDGYMFVSGVAVKPLPTNKNYNILIKDSCGRSFTQNFYLPAPVVPQATATASLYRDGCIDSTAFAFVFTDNMRGLPALILTSVPAQTTSTKSGYEHVNTYKYPDTLPPSGFGGTSYRFDVSDLGVGTFKCKVIDSCGTTVFDSIVVKPADVTNYSHRFWYKKGCLGKNELHYELHTVNGTMFVERLNSTDTWTQNYESQNFDGNIEDSLLNLPSGIYVLTYTYQKYFRYGTPASEFPVTCQVISDTVVIEGYKTPAVLAGNYIQCKAGIHLEILADSTTGVPPYEYEIISGPQTFPMQSSNIFNITAAGIYNVRIYDVCGNASTSQVTVTPIAFPPVSVLPSACNSTSLTYGSSAYYGYTWTSPGGTVYTGDTLTINPVTPADTGMYQIRKIVQFGSCSDTFYTTYHLILHNTSLQNISLCQGDTLSVGNHHYTATGIYNDTLVNGTFCDSIIVTNLVVSSYKKDSLNYVICAGQGYLFNGNTYTLPGIYRDTLRTTTCDSIVTLNLTVSPPKRDSINKTLCFGESYPFNGHVYSAGGIYRDTLSTVTCDSIVTLNLIVSSLKRDSVNKTICAGQGYLFNGNAYTLPGIYRDTLSTVTCDSIVTLNLTVSPLKRDSISKILCFGESYLFNGHMYSADEIYRDTLSTAACDSIVTLRLVVLPEKKDSVTHLMCRGDFFSYNGQPYTRPGIYKDTISTATCDSVVTLHVSWYPAEPAHITTSTSTVFPGDTIHLSVTTAATYLWSSPAALIPAAAIQNPDAYITSSAWIYVKTTSVTGSCASLDSIYITALDKQDPCPASSIYLPNSFTPNGDGVNDVYRLIANKISLDRFVIFNRWGQKVFETNDFSQGWNGMYKGMVILGTYVYMVTYYVPCNTTLRMIKGSVVLLK